MVEFHSTRGGRKYYENHVPRIASVLEKIAVELERSNNMKEDFWNPPIEQIALDIEPFEPTLARLLREYI